MSCIRRCVWSSVTQPLNRGPRCLSDRRSFESVVHGTVEQQARRPPHPLHRGGVAIVQGAHAIRPACWTLSCIEWKLDIKQRRSAEACVAPAPADTAGLLQHIAGRRRMPEKAG